MRLLNTHTCRLEDFAANDIPRYAILSHTWGANELLYEDMASWSVDQKEEYQKIRSACRLALADSLDYIWIDTCCIDKKSSAELSEAINSMFIWYQRAQVCYAYLEDVPSNWKLRDEDSSFAKSRWFRRGWTLQELLAPSNLFFYSSNWNVLGNKSDLQDVVVKITGIPEDILDGSVELASTSIAQKMSWASDRETTRVEDIAYCLMGIFSVNMPLLYGEEEKAFIRLQEEIIKSSDDHSLFAWTDPSADYDDTPSGLLAKSPSYFRDCGDILRWGDHISRPYAMTNKGLEIELGLTYFHGGRYFAALDCPVREYPQTSKQVFILLKRLRSVDQQYGRIHLAWRTHTLMEVENQRIFVRNKISTISPKDIFRPHVVLLRLAPSKSAIVASDHDSQGDNTFELHHILFRPCDRPRDAEQAEVYSTPYTFDMGINRLAAALWFRNRNGSSIVLMVGTNPNGQTGVKLESRPYVDDLRELESAFEPKSASQGAVGMESLALRLGHFREPLIFLGTVFEYCELTGTGWSNALSKPEATKSRLSKILGSEDTSSPRLSAWARLKARKR